MPSSTGSGIRRHRHQRRRDAAGLQGDGPGLERVQRAHARPARRPSRHRPHPLLHHRFQQLAQRLAVFRDVDVAEFALGHNGNLVNTERLSDGRACWPAPSRATAIWSPRWSPPSSWRPGPLRRPGARAGARAGSCPGSRGRSRSCSWTRATSSASGTPAACAPSASAGSTLGGSWPPRPRPRRHGCPLRAGAGAGRDGRRRRHRGAVAPPLRARAG